jgi:sugar transferase (PEP-CTERM/EpsH1 system associated)
MPHVVHVLHSLEVGGTENGAVNLIGALPELTHTVVSMNGSGPLADRLPAGVRVFRLDKRPGVDLRAMGRLVALLRRLRPDVVHSRNWATFDAIPAAKLAGARAVVHGEHGRDISDPHGLRPRRIRMRRLVSPIVTRFVTVSVDLRRWLVGTVGIPEAKVVTILNGVNLDRFSDEGRAEGRAALGLPADAVVVGTVGRLDPVKDQMGLLEAFAAMRDEAARAVLVLIGDGPCRADLAARAARPDLAGRVRLYGERPDVPRLLPGLDVFALPPLAEGIANTVLEAMASGLPVVATRTGGNPELVEDGVTGTLVPVANRHALAAALAAYFQDPHLRSAHGKAGRARAVAEFGLDRMVGRYRDLYLGLARRGAA